MWEKYDDNNIFAKILRGELPCKKVYESDHVLAFKNINPVAPVHVLVVPKTKYISFDDFAQKASAEEVKTFFAEVQKVAAELKLTGYKVNMNVFPEGGQEVPHLHVHLLSK